MCRRLNQDTVNKHCSCIFWSVNTLERTTSISPRLLQYSTDQVYSYCTGFCVTKHVHGNTGMQMQGFLYCTVPLTHSLVFVSGGREAAVSMTVVSHRGAESVSREKTKHRKQLNATAVETLWDTTGGKRLAVPSERKQQREENHSQATDITYINAA